MFHCISFKLNLLCLLHAIPFILVLVDGVNGWQNNSRRYLNVIIITAVYSGATATRWIMYS